MTAKDRAPTPEQDFRSVEVLQGLFAPAIEQAGRAGVPKDVLYMYLLGFVAAGLIGTMGRQTAVSMVQEIAAKMDGGFFNPKTRTS